MGTTLEDYTDGARRAMDNDASNLPATPLARANVAPSGHDDVRGRPRLTMRTLRILHASAAVTTFFALPALAADASRTFESKTDGYRVEYPTSWHLFNPGVDALQILSFPPSQRIEGVVIRSGGASISVGAAPAGEHDLDAWVRKEIDSDLRFGDVIGRREIPVGSPAPAGCTRLTRVDSETDVSGSGKAYQVTATYYCSTDARLYAVSVTNWKGDRKQPEYRKVALRIARSLRTLEPSR